MATEFNPTHRRDASTCGVVLDPHPVPYPPQHHAVAGAYGIQEGLYVPANELFDTAFGTHWSNAHANKQQALDEVAALATETLTAGGNLWIADAGQSDFSAALIRRLTDALPDLDARGRIHVVQHSDWNESVTTPADLAYVRATATYHKIPDGNAVGNGTPGFRHEGTIDWRSHITTPTSSRPGRWPPPSPTATTARRAATSTKPSPPVGSTSPTYQKRATSSASTTSPTPRSSFRPSGRRQIHKYCLAIVDVNNQEAINDPPGTAEQD